MSFPFSIISTMQSSHLSQRASKPWLDIVLFGTPNHTIHQKAQFVCWKSTNSDGIYTTKKKRQRDAGHNSVKTHTGQSLKDIFPVWAFRRETTRASAGERIHIGDLWKNSGKL